MKNSLWDKNQLLGYKGYAVLTNEMIYHAESSTVHARKFIEQMKMWAKPSPVQEDPSNFSDWEEHKKSFESGGNGWKKEQIE